MILRECIGWGIVPGHGLFLQFYSLFQESPLTITQSTWQRPCFARFRRHFWDTGRTVCDVTILPNKGATLWYDYPDYGTGRAVHSWSTPVVRVNGAMSFKQEK